MATCGAYQVKSPNLACPLADKFSAYLGKVYFDFHYLRLT